jgi:Leucine-rich repeat (LRR) protein
MEHPRDARNQSPERKANRVEEIDRFVVNGIQFLQVDSSRLDDCRRICLDEGITALAINNVNGFALPTLEFLRRFQFVTHIDLFSKGTGWALEPLSSLPALRALRVGYETKAPIPSNVLQHLEYLSIYWAVGFPVEQCKRLGVLRLQKYNPPSRSLSELARSTITQLELAMTTIESLDGVEGLGNLKSLDVDYASHLANINALVRIRQRLEWLRISRAKSLDLPGAIRELTNLRTLVLNKCKPLKSIDFLNEMVALDEFRFVDVDVADGDLTPLTRLKSFAFYPEKRHYSHKLKELQGL